MSLREKSPGRRQGMPGRALKDWGAARFRPWSTGRRRRFIKYGLIAISIVLLYWLPAMQLPILPAPGIDFASMLFFPIGIYVLLAMGLDVMVGKAGLPNLCYAAFFAVGAYTTAILSTRTNMGYFATLLPALVMGVLFGCLLSLISLRVKGHYLAIITLGAGLIVQDILSHVGFFGGTLGISSIPHPSNVFGIEFGVVDQRPYVWLVVTAILIGAVVLIRIDHGRVGRGWRALRDDELAASVCGVRTTRWKVAAFAVGGGFGGVAGSLYAGEVGFIDPSTFNLTLSVLILAAVVIVGKGRLWTVVAGAIVVAYLPERFYVIQQWNDLVFGLFLAVIMVVQPRGLAALVASGGDRLFLRRKAISDDPPFNASPADPASRVSTVAEAAEEGIQADFRRNEKEVVEPGSSSRADVSTEDVLSVSNITVAYGGLRVLEGVSFSLKRGEVLSLVGPNGAGKTTMLNVITGLVTPDQGEVAVGGRVVSSKASQWRSRHGLARTFQNIRLFESMSVLENVLVAAEARQSSGLFGSVFGSAKFRREKGQAHAWAMECLRAVGLEGSADALAVSLSYGQQRRLEVARALGLEPTVLLLDEPAAGSNPVEKHDLAQMIEHLSDLGYSILLIEHDMRLVMRVSDRMIVLNFGQLIGQGTPEQMRNDAAVAAAYFGGDVHAH